MPSYPKSEKNKDYKPYIIKIYDLYSQVKKQILTSNPLFFVHEKRGNKQP